MHGKLTSFVNPHFLIEINMVRYQTISFKFMSKNTFAKKFQKICQKLNGTIFTHKDESFRLTAKRATYAGGVLGVVSWEPTSL